MLNPLSKAVSVPLASLTAFIKPSFQLPKLLSLFAIVSLISACNLTVEIDNEQGGRVVSEDGKIDCPDTTCKHNYTDTQAEVTLSAIPNEGFVFAGFSMHDELLELTKSGLSNLEALQSATIVPAKYSNMLNDFGTIEIGKKADIVLLDKNVLRTPARCTFV